MFSKITLGFELMLAKESPRNLFRFLITRDVNLEALEGILVDFGCLFEPYVMNREANMLEKIHVLVDGSHWAGHKPLKKSDKSGKGGHLGYVILDFFPTFHFVLDNSILFYSTLRLV